MSFLKNLITGGLFGAVTDISKELIDTPLEKAQAQVLKIKAIDPNGKMRREISSGTMHLYKIYIYVMLGLLMAQSFDVGDAKQIMLAVNNMKELFMPITGAFGTIMAASFGVNGVNSYKGS